MLGGSSPKPLRLIMGGVMGDSEFSSFPVFYRFSTTVIISHEKKNFIFSYSNLKEEALSYYTCDFYNQIVIRFQEK